MIWYSHYIAWYMEICEIIYLIRNIHIAIYNLTFLQFPFVLYLAIHRLMEGTQRRSRQRWSHRLHPPGIPWYPVGDSMEMDGSNMDQRWSSYGSMDGSMEMDESSNSFWFRKCQDQKWSPWMLQALRHEVLFKTGMSSRHWEWCLHPLPRARGFHNRRKFGS